MFARRGTHDVPMRISPSPPPDLAISYRREAKHLGVAPALEEAHQLLVDWLQPVLDEIHKGRDV